MCGHVQGIQLLWGEWECPDGGSFRMENSCGSSRPSPSICRGGKEQSHWEMHGPHLIKGIVVLTASIKVLSRDATG